MLCRHFLALNFFSHLMDKFVFSVILLISIFSLSKSLIINRCVKDKDVALTFEDGPSIKSTTRLLDLLDALNVKATFHVVTRHFNFPEVQNIMSDIISRGHVLGYRLEAEWTMQDITKEGIQGAVDYRLEMIKKASGKKPKFVRTSFNATELLKDALTASGLILTVPNFESNDYTKDFNINLMLNRFDSLALGSVISVQREFADELFETTKVFVEHLRSMNYNIVTLQECTGISQIYSEQAAISPVISSENYVDITNSTAQIDQATKSSSNSINISTSIVPFSILFSIFMFILQ